MKRFVAILLIFSIAFGCLVVRAADSDEPAVPADFKAVTASYNSIKLSWAAVSDAKGYVIYNYDPISNISSRLKVTLDASSTVSLLSTGVTYYFKVRAYKNVDGINIYGAPSDAVFATPVPGTPTSCIATATSPKGSTKVSWKAVSGATGYVIYHSSLNSKDFVRFKVTKATSYSTKEKFYYYKVITYRTVNDKNVYGKPSKGFSTPEISTKGLKSKMPGATILQAWKIVENDTTVLVHKLSYGSPIITSYKGRTFSIPQICIIAMVTCKPENFRNTCALLTLNKDEALVNDMAKKVGAIIAINNECYSGHWSSNPNVVAAFLCDGPVVKESVVVQNRGKSYKGSAVYKDGTWVKGVTISPSNVNNKLADGLSYTLCPCTGGYIWDGEQQVKFGPQTSLMSSLRDRTLCAQIDKSHYLLMVGEYMQLDTMMHILLKYGAQKGFVCNGGNCSYMYLRGAGNVTGTVAPQLDHLDKLNVLEQEWLGLNNLIAPGAKGAACPAIDIIYVK